MNLSETLASPWRVRLAGREFWLSPLTLADWAILEQRLLDGRGDPLAMARQALDAWPADQQPLLLEAALAQAARSRRASLDELLEFADSPTGIVLGFWLSLRKRHPEIDESQAARLLEQLALEEQLQLAAGQQRLRGLPESNAPSTPPDSAKKPRGRAKRAASPGPN